MLSNGEKCRDSTLFHANYMYPIVQFAPMHPCNLVNLDSPEATLKLARQTVYGQNNMSKWTPTNGLCLAWPSAAKTALLNQRQNTGNPHHNLIEQGSP